MLGLAFLLACAPLPALAASSDGGRPPATSPSGASDPWARFSGPEFNHFPSSLRLPSDVVTSLAQTREGLIWFGTLGGLVRFDGYRTQIYRGAVDMLADGPSSGTPDSLSRTLPDAYVRALLFTEDGGLLVGTNAGGLVRFDVEANGFRTVPILRGTAASRVMSMAVARDGGAWIVSDLGLDHYDPGTGSVRAVADSGAMGVSPRLFVVFEDSRGTLWLGGHPGLYRRAAGEAAFTRVAAPAGDPAAAEALADDIWTLYEDGRGRLWVGTGESGVLAIDVASGTVHGVAGLTGPDSAAVHHTVRAVLEPEGAQGPLWLATDGAGILSLDRDSGVLATLTHSDMVESSLAGDVVRALLRDRGGNLWVGTHHGLDRVEPGVRVVSTVQRAPPDGVGLGDPDVHALAVDGRDRVWMGLARGLVDVLDLTAGTIRHLQLPGAERGSDVFSLAPLPDGTILAGGRGVARIEPDSMDIVPSWIPELDDAPALSLAVADDRVLVGGYDGLYVRGGDGTLTHFAHDPTDPESLPANQVNRILVQPAGAGVIWLATIGGLAVADLADLPRLRFRTLRRTPLAGKIGALPHDVVNDLAMDGGGNLWIGTFGGGVAVLTPAQMNDMRAGKAGTVTPRVIDEMDGLADNAVMGLTVDGTGNVWATAGSSLVKFNGPGFPPRVIGARDGVLVRAFNTQAAARGPGGEVLFGGLSGLTIVRPAALRPSSPVGVLAITAADVNHRALPPGRLPAPGGTLTLGAGVKTIRLALSLLDFRAPQDTRYAYRLDGFDEDWVEVTGAQPQAVYTNLPHGDYTFRLRAWTDLPGLILSNRQEATAGFDPDAEPLATGPAKVSRTAAGLAIAPMAELAFRLKVLPRWYEQAWFRLLMVFGVVAVLACVLAVRTEAQMRRERALGRIVAARTRDLRNANTKLEQLASTDPLTGILNRRRFFELARLECDRSRRYGRGFSVILFDLDHFKRVNDTFGHLMGDEVLRAAVAVAGKACRSVDLLARFGGEEVMLLLPETDIAGAQLVAERIRTGLAEMEVAYGGQMARITASLGVAQWRSPDETLEALLARADGALYQAKKGGRNRTVLACNEVERAGRMGWAIVPSAEGEAGELPIPVIAEAPPLEPLARLAGLGDTALVDPYEREAYDRPVPAAGPEPDAEMPGAASE
ncbi:ligand-binding sensor domain-containing diguanylate cyclase [Nitrospirillum iridis]|uniref:ligand-binding sensor domain-containing diguanylate cyclase n=1 Tax=Nitrospirillum iridis TaxID=765888 RepID=UPI001FE648A9|nr:ligand-binding sensor domain-containing diguanylate cyclase [Nitrospirillum iridis]